MTAIDGIRLVAGVACVCLGAFMILRARQIAARSEKHRAIPWRLLGTMLVASGALQAIASIV